MTGGLPGVWRKLPLLALSLLLSSMAKAQVPETQPPERVLGGPVVQSGRVANSTIGQVGQRRTRQQAAQGIAPMARVASRIQNRIETRVHSRIDRGYDPLATGTSAFSAAEKEVRDAGRRR